MSYLQNIISQTIINPGTSTGGAGGATGWLKLGLYRAPYPVILSEFDALRLGGTGAVVTLLKNGAAVSSGITITTATWAAKSFTTGLVMAKDDSLEFKITGLSVSTKALSLQVRVKIDQWYLHMDN